MSGVPVARIAVQCRLDVAKAVREVLQFDLREREHRSEPPVVAIGRGEGLEDGKLFCLPAGLA